MFARRATLVASLVVVAVLVVVGVAAAAWVTLDRARADLNAARAELQTVVDDPAALRTAAGRATAINRIDVAAARIYHARRRVRGSPVLQIARVVPGFATQRHGVLQLVDDARTAVGAGRSLAGQLDALAPRTQLRDGVVPFAGIAGFERAARASGQAFRSVVHSPSGLWFQLRDARRSFNETASSTASRLLNGADGLAAARAFAGERGDRRYLVALQNNAEMRDQGMVLSYALVRFAGGRLTFEKAGHISDLQLKQATATAIPAGTEQSFGFTAPTRLWQSVNVTADRAWSGRAMRDMYAQTTGQTVDGVIAVDVPAISDLLRAVGPLAVPGLPAPVSSNDVGRVLLHDIYEGIPNKGGNGDAKLVVQAEAVGVVAERLTRGSTDLVTVGRELADAAAGGHLWLWSADPVVETTLETARLGGGPAIGAAHQTFHLAIENRTSNKLDYYVRPSVQATVRVDKRGTVRVTTTVTLENRAPPGPPSYQLGPAEPNERVANYRAWALLWAPSGSLGNDPLESGLRLNQRVVDVGPGQRQRVVFDTVIPGALTRDGRLMLRFVPQPRLDATDLDVRVVAPGIHVAGPRSSRVSWDRVRRYEWRFTR